MICSDIKALVMARCLECVTSTSYDMAHTDDVRRGLDCGVVSPRTGVVGGGADQIRYNKVMTTDDMREY